RARLFDLRSDLAALEADSEDWRRAAAQRQIQQTEGLQGMIEALIARLEPLRQRQEAASFIEHFQRVVDEYIDPTADALEKVKAEIEQLGTVAQVGGQLALAGFVHSLRANLEIASDRRVSLG